MAWDDDKGAGDGLPSSEWDAMVADQKSRNKSVISDTEPPTSNYSEGDAWYVTGKTTESGDLSGDTGSDIFSFAINQSDGVLYAGDNNGTVTAINISDGSTVWSVANHSTYVSELEYGATDGLVYSADHNGVFYALNESDGTTNWNTTSTEQNYVYGVEYDGTNGRLYFGTTQNSLPYFDSATGEESTLHTLNTDYVSGISYNSTDDVVYSGGRDQQVVAANTSDGTEVWSNGTPFSDTITDIDYSSTEGSVFAASKVGNMTSLSDVDGAQINQVSEHSVDIIHTTYSSVSNKVYSAGSDDKVVAYNESDITNVPYSISAGSTVEDITFYDSTESIIVEDSGYVEYDEITSGREYILINGEWARSL